MSPHSAALALGRVLSTVAASRRIDRNVVQMLHDVSLRAVRDMHDDGATGEMRRYVIKSLLDGGDRRPPPGHVHRLAELFGDVDDYEQYKLADYEASLQERLMRDMDDGTNR